ncbi:hypothetical protein NBRC116187_31620 [Halopseudomonas sabulinigri]|uniref:Uncharacterized protein n=1 Tax=Halopseudomonas sabulinigri TaxID=472181 RepID=A0ABP9ZTN6_9GAMM
MPEAETIDAVTAPIMKGNVQCQSSATKYRFTLKRENKAGRSDEAPSAVMGQGEYANTKRRK